MAIKKSVLYRRLWDSCNELRSGMDASQYKDYILVLLFMRYVTDKHYGKDNALIEVPEGGSFHDLVALKGDKEIGDKTNKVIRKMADANDLVGVITVADFNDSDKLGSGADMVELLTNLVAIFEDSELDFRGNRADGDDILGDAYEYLMRHFATESGKSKGQFYTPAEVSRIMAKIIGIDKAKSQSQTIYDPTCGSGSLLLKAADEAERGVTIYGQEKDVATVALAKMNMILHGNEIAEIKKGNTISSPEFKNLDGTLKTFDFAVANPPFSTKSWSKGMDPQNDEFDRFTGYGVPPAKNGDYAFLLHFIKSLKSKGKGAIILPHGVLFRGNAEAVIRENIIKKGYLKGIIGMPANLFYGTGIPAAILVIDKENAEERKGIFMIDASKGFIKDGNKNRLQEKDVHKIVDVFNNHHERPKYSRMVSIEEIESNEYNLNLPRYIDNQEEEDIQDIDAHLKGGIPARDVDELQDYWDVYPTLKETLFESHGRDGYYNLLIEQEQIKDVIFNHPEFIQYSKEVNSIINDWAQRHIDRLMSIDSDEKPKDLINDIAEDILNSFSNRTLIDQYDIYQYLMDYWLEIMKDDAYMIVENGWIPDKDLVPESVVINNYFFEEKSAITSIELEKEETIRQKEEFEVENAGEEGLLEEVKNDKGNITKGNLKNRIKEIKNDPEYLDELKALKFYLRLTDEESAANKKIKEATKALNKKVDEKYKNLTGDEIKNLVVDNKWILFIIGEINHEMNRVSYRLAARIKELAERYDETLSYIQEQVNYYSGKVDKYLERMGY